MSKETAKALSPQREAFAQGIADGKSQADAYRLAYPRSKKWKPETVWQAASRLMCDSKVLARVEELRAQLAEKKLWTREDSVKALRDIVERKEIDPDTQMEIRAQDKDIIGAVKELNAMHGFNAPVKLEHSGEIKTITVTYVDKHTDSESI